MPNFPPDDSAPTVKCTACQDTHVCPGCSGTGEKWYGREPKPIVPARCVKCNGTGVCMSCK